MHRIVPHRHQSCYRMASASDGQNLSAGNSVKQARQMCLGLVRPYGIHIAARCRLVYPTSQGIILAALALPAGENGHESLPVLRDAK